MKLLPDQSFSAHTHQDAWEKLKQFTDARIALGRAGCSIPTKALLEFQLAHAQARDAVHQRLDHTQLQQQLHMKGFDSLVVKSQATDKEIFLKCPDLGRLLSEDSIALLKHHQAHPYDVCIVIGDGLSALAIHENATAFIELLYPLLQAQQWTIAPIVIATGSRVALGDQIAETLNSKMLIMLIGERPGLSSPDSMGMYYTWQAKTGTLDSARNCISNIRPAGLSLQIAAQRLIKLMTSSNSLGYSGVKLKDEHEEPLIETQQQQNLLF